MPVARSHCRSPLLWRLHLLTLALAGAPAWAQTAEPPAPASSAPRPAPASPAQRVEITGGRHGDVDERRESTAAKIVIGREELERFGDSTLADVMKRLPGVTAPGGGRGIRMRGMGGGYTQILLDGQRVPPGFSLETMNPEQIERIEILRAPTAETGGRAVAGTINIITRSGFVKRVNDLHLGLGWRNGKLSPGVSYTRNGGGDGPFSYNASLSVFRPGQASESTTLTTRRAGDGSVALQQRVDSRSEDRRTGLHANARLQWRLNEQGDHLLLMPFLVRWQGGGDSVSTLQTLAGSTQSCEPGVTGCAPDPVYDRALGEFDNRFTLARLNGQLRHTLGDTRLEWRGGFGDGRSHNHTLRREFNTAGGLLDTLDEVTRSQERSATLNLKASRTVGQGHHLVAGGEWEQADREEQGLRNGAPVLAEAANLQATTRRLAAYLQDEWSLNPQWALHLGGRWEGIRTSGEGASLAGVGQQRNTSSVFTPVLHAVWKPDPKRRDQVRVSLTRSYKSPTVQQLIGRPVIAQHNAETRPDRVGNPQLQPELATGIDLAFERYLEGGGVLSANVFHRRIRQLIRTRTERADSVPWAAGPRWVSSPQNIGSAITQGLELEAKFRLDTLWPQAPAVDLRSNASVYHSKVDQVPGPDNRLDEQPRATLNFGADYRVRGTPVSLGGNLSLTPGYVTRLSDNQWLEQSQRRGFDAYLLWTFNPELRLRVSANNLAPLDERSLSTVGLQTAESTSAGHTQWQLRLEMKL